MNGRRIIGALMGWKRKPSENGIVITFQIAPSLTAATEKQFDRVSVALNDRQLRSLARDLLRAAQERDIQLWATPKWVKAVNFFLKAGHRATLVRPVPAQFRDGIGNDRPG